MAAFRAVSVPFSGPDGAWLTGELRPVAEDLLGSGRPMLEQFVDPGGLKALLKESANEIAAPQRLWTMLGTEIWLRTFFGDQVDATVLQ